MHRIEDLTEWRSIMQHYSCIGKKQREARFMRTIPEDAVLKAEEDFRAGLTTYWGSHVEGYLRTFMHEGENHIDFGKPFGRMTENIEKLLEHLNTPLILPVEVPGIGEIPGIDYLPVVRDTRQLKFTEEHPLYRIGFPNSGLVQVYEVDPDAL